MDEKRCSTCHFMRPLSEFNKRSRAVDGLQSRCRSCSAAWYHFNSVEHRANVRARNDRVRKENMQRLAVHLHQHPCVDCGEDDLRVLDLDHEDPAEKRSAVAKLIASAMHWPAIEAEIAKCSVRCANCHRRRTSDMFGYWRSGVEQQRRDDRRDLALGRLQTILG